MPLEIEKLPGGDLVVALDPTGWKVMNRGEWMREKRKRDLDQSAYCGGCEE